MSKYIEALVAFGWTVSCRYSSFYCDHGERHLNLPMGYDPRDGLIVFHEVGHALDASLAIAAAEGIHTTPNDGRKLRAECVAWSWTLRHAQALDADEWTCFREAIGWYIDEACRALRPIAPGASTHPRRPRH